MIQAFFLGPSQEISRKLKEHYQSFQMDPDYYLSSKISCGQKSNWKELLPKHSSAIIYYEVSDSIEKEKAAIQEIKNTNPKFQWVLFANPDSDFFELASAFNIGNILRKNQFDASLIRALTIRLMTGNLFGFQPYFPNGYSLKPIHKTVTGATNLKDILDFFEKNFLPYIDPKLHNRMSTYFNELLVNTVTYSVTGMSEQDRDKGMLSISGETFTPVEKSFKISMAMDREKYAISIIDSTGTLSLKRILGKLRRQTKIGEEELPPGIWDLSGRGLSLILKDNRMIINILKNHYTEIIFLHYLEQELNKYESIIVTELVPVP